MTLRLTSLTQRAANLVCVPVLLAVFLNSAHGDEEPYNRSWVVQAYLIRGYAGYMAAAYVPGDGIVLAPGRCTWATNVEVLSGAFGWSVGPSWKLAVGTALVQSFTTNFEVPGVYGALPLRVYALRLHRDGPLRTRQAYLGLEAQPPWGSGRSWWLTLSAGAALTYPGVTFGLEAQVRMTYFSIGVTLGIGGWY